MSDAASIPSLASLTRLAAVAAVALEIGAVALYLAWGLRYDELARRAESIEPTWISSTRTWENVR